MFNDQIQIEDRQAEREDRASLLIHPMEANGYTPLHYPGKQGWEGMDLFFDGYCLATIRKTEGGLFVADYTTDLQNWRQIGKHSPTLEHAQSAVGTVLGYHGISVSTQPNEWKANDPHNISATGSATRRSSDSLDTQRTALGIEMEAK